MPCRWHLGLSASVLLIGLVACQKTPTQPSPPCEFTLSTSSLQFEATGGDASVSVATAGHCSWTAAAAVSWLAITSGSSVTGPGAATLAAADNSDFTPRTGSVIVAGQTVAVLQEGLAPCTFTIDPATASTSPVSTTGTINVSAAAYCQWTALSTTNWLRVTSGSSGAGAGVVTYAVDLNTDTAERRGTIEIAGEIFTLIQAGNADSCTYRVEPVTLAICMAWTADLISTVMTEDGCPWEAVSAAPWMSVIGGRSGIGSGSVRIGGSDNWEAPRTGVVEIRWPTITAGQNVRVQQAGCFYGVSRDAFSFAAGGGAGTFDVLQQSDPIACGGPLQNACQWSPESSSSWISVAGPTVRTGDDRVSFVVAANTTGAARTGRIQVRDRVVTIVQAGN